MFLHRKQFRRYIGERRCSKFSSGFGPWVWVDWCECAYLRPAVTPRTISFYILRFGIASAALAAQQPEVVTRLRVLTDRNRVCHCRFPI